MNTSSEIEILTPFGDTVLLRKSGNYTVEKWGPCTDRFQRLYDIGTWLNKEWWPMCFDRDYYQLRVEDISELPEHT